MLKMNKWSNSFTCLNRINSSMDPLQNTERFGNGIYTVICGNHSVTVIQSPKSKSNNHKMKKIHTKHLNLWSNPSLYLAWVVSFKMSLCCLYKGRPSVPVLKAIAIEGSSNLAKLVCTSEGNPKPTIRWDGNR